LERISLSLERLWLAGVGGKIVMMGILSVLVWCWLPATGKRRIVLSAALVAAALHMGFGHFGWFYRYELYAIAFCGLIAVAALAERSPRLVLPLSALAALAYLMPIFLTPGGAHNVYLQHHQMHRFVTEHWRKPFAVNDLGWVSVGNDPGTYVLDLWGLASNEAVRQRSKNAPWLDEVTRRHGVGLAMVYPTWFPQVPASWRKVAELSFDRPVVTIAGNVVYFYSTGGHDGEVLKARLAEFAPSLPQGAVLKLH
jgi:hypothetical protein